MSCDRAFELDSDSGTNCGYERKNYIGCLSFRMQHAAALVVLLVAICSLSRGWASEDSEPPGEHFNFDSCFVYNMGEGLLLDDIRLRMCCECERLVFALECDYLDVAFTITSMANASRRSRVGVGMNRSVREGKTCKAL